ncbi:hypothetical protein [Ulvibacter antarcticus]|nr:hypothetical protein [Ulvibacter antarcticus]
MEVGSGKWDVGSWKLEVGSLRHDEGSGKLEARSKNVLNHASYV